ncbi:antitoxin Xre/MbcA/ParS toxin-binding domain-containing protein [Pseudomonas sp. MMS21 TM103]|uniref:antitoxin Xre/MbcA/ParS toxin-binding domain-containing protein n=1 Tax=Pseudomonas sp. MMS21 TM103 TaxID=2886506 RepID=UPI0022AA17C0|nr:antitoxin Xre/MbcA/ParS toxin-binding domain-containing protein [Pseudomonas sp. MMS21 TM103]
MTSSTQPQRSCSAPGSPLEILLNGRAPISDSLSIYKLVESLTLNDLARMAKSADVSRKNQIVAAVLGESPNTVRRRLKHPDKLLNPDQGARALRFAQILTQAQDIFRDRSAASRWFFEPAIGLGGENPVQLLLNPFGYELVVDLMMRIEHGVYH